MPHAPIIEKRDCLEIIGILIEKNYDEKDCEFMDLVQGKDSSNFNRLRLKPLIFKYGFVRKTPHKYYVLDYQAIIDFMHKEFLNTADQTIKRNGHRNELFPESQEKMHERLKKFLIAQRNQVSDIGLYEALESFVLGIGYLHQVWQTMPSKNKNDSYKYLGLNDIEPSFLAGCYAYFHQKLGFGLDIITETMISPMTPQEKKKLDDFREENKHLATLLEK